MMQRFEDWCGTERKRSPNARAAWNAARLAAAEHLREAAGFLGRGRRLEPMSPEALAADLLRAHADLIAGTRSARRVAALNRILDDFHEQEGLRQSDQWNAGLEHAAQIVEGRVFSLPAEIRKEKA